MKDAPLATALVRVALGTAALLLVPLAAMQFSAEFRWGWGDFVMAGILLFAAGTAIVLAKRKIRQPLHRAAAAAGIAIVFALVWAELAVGLFR